MKSDRKILLAFMLNLGFSIFEFFGGVLSGSVAISSDAVHDLGDAISIGISYLLERKSKKKPDARYTYGYVGYSVLGGLITSCVLFFGSLAVITSSVHRLFYPTAIHYDGMIVFAIIGVIVNFLAALLTHHGESLNQKAVNLHMLEDVLGWIVVLLGAVVMRFTDFYWIDPLLSIGVAVFILIHACKSLWQILSLLLHKVPKGVSVDEIAAHVKEVPGVLGVHHVHVHSLDGVTCTASMHVVTDADPILIKQLIRQQLCEHGISHVTLELEKSDEVCCRQECGLHMTVKKQHAHHHHH